MYKLLIVEDEIKIRNGLAKRVPWDDLGYTVCGLAANGNEALSLIEADCPDVVLTDVRMPEMDGLQLAEIINEKFPHINILILSGYADFEYARQAIKLKIYDYLLKPTDKEILINTFKSLKLKKDQASFLDKQHREKQFQIKAGLEKYKEYFLSKLLAGEYSFIYTLQDQLNSLELNLDGNVFCVCTLHIDIPEHVLETEWRNNRDLLKFSYGNIISELLDETGCGAVFVRDINQASVIFSFPSENELHSQMHALIHKAMRCVNKLIFEGRAKIVAGVGKTYNNILNVHTSQLEAEKALKKRFFKTDKLMFEYTENIELENEKRLIKGYREDSNNIVAAALNGQTEEMTQLLDALKTSLSSQTEVRDIKNYYYVLCFLLKTSLAEFEMDSDIIKNSDYENCIFGASNLEKLSAYVKSVFVGASEHIARTQDDDSTFKQKVISEVKHFIEYNYKENLTLKKIGQHVHLSPSYISFLFKEVTGETYTEYLKYIRIQNAKTLLRRVDLKIYEIAEKVGYNDYKYFTLQFKKITGMSPTEYRCNL